MSRGPSWSVSFAARRATAARRPLPSLLIIGAVKAGTTTLHHSLARHPQLIPPAIKEIHYFDRPQNFAAGPGWYRAHWPVPTPGADRLAFESTPFYLPLPEVPERIRSLLPDVRLVVLLRNPTDRAISHHAHQVRLGHETLSLADALDAEEARLAVGGATATRALTHFGYRKQGQYAEQLERVFAAFPPEQVLVMLSHDFARSPDEHVGQVLGHLGLRLMHGSVAGLRLNVGPSREVEQDIRADLDRHFAPWNRRLARQLNRSLDWPGA